MPESERMLFVQVLLGLQALHDSGWIHRDLKPADLGIVELESGPHAIIMDEAQAIKCEGGKHKPSVGHCGTVGFLAPELESSAVAQTYGFGVDIWSMGAVACYIFFHGRIPWSTQYNMFVPERNNKDPSLSVYRDVQADLVRHPQGSLENVIGQMLAEKADQRPGITSILTHPVLRATRDAIDADLDAEPRTGRKRGYPPL